MNQCSRRKRAGQGTVFHHLEPFRVVLPWPPLLRSLLSSSLLLFLGSTKPVESSLLCRLMESDLHAYSHKGTVTHWQCGTVKLKLKYFETGRCIGTVHLPMQTCIHYTWSCTNSQTCLQTPYTHRHMSPLHTYIHTDSYTERGRKREMCSPSLNWCSLWHGRQVLSPYLQGQTVVYTELLPPYNTGGWSDKYSREMLIVLLIYLFNLFIYINGFIYN